MNDFRTSKEVGTDLWPNMPKINLKHPITEAGYVFCMSAIVRANEVLNAETFEEVYKIVDEDIYSYFVDMDTYKVVEDYGDLELLKERLLIHFYSYIIHTNYTGEIRVRGPKGDRMKRFFNAVTAEPQDAGFLAEKCELKYSVVKNHRRFDTFPERGLTKIKNGDIFRQPVDG
jgi:hypothetical protein